MLDEATLARINSAIEALENLNGSLNSGVSDINNLKAEVAKSVDILVKVFSSTKQDVTLLDGVTVAPSYLKLADELINPLIEFLDSTNESFTIGTQTFETLYKFKSEIEALKANNSGTIEEFEATITAGTTYDVVSEPTTVDFGTVEDFEAILI